MYLAHHYNKDSQKGFIAQIGLVVIGLIIASAFFLLYITKLKATPAPAPVAQELTLPKNAVQISACVPFMGEHWVELDKLPQGPYYVVNKGKVIALEYMFKQAEIPGFTLANMGPDEAKAYIKDNNLTFGQIMRTQIPTNIDFPAGFTPKFWDMEWSAPHAGLVAPHYDLHFYSISNKEELKTICPDAAVGSELPPEMAKEMQRLGVPIP